MATGRPTTSSKAASGIRVMTASSVPLSRPDEHRRDTDHQAAPAGQSGQQGGQGQPDAGRPGRGRGDGGQLGVLVPDGPELGVGGTEGDELGRALGEVDHGRRQIAAHRGEPATPAAGPGAR